MTLITSRIFNRRVFAFAVIVCLFLGLFTSHRLNAQAVNCDEYPQLTLNEQISVATEYDVWVLAKRETATASAYVKINGGECSELKIPTTDQWTWIQGRSGAIRTALGAGNNTFEFSVNGGAILFDKMIATNDLGCAPVNSGENCVNEQLEFFVDGIQNNDVVAEARTVRANILSDSPSAVMRFYIDDVLVSEQNQAPYCLVANGSECAPYDFVASINTPGEHTLKVEGIIPDQPSVQQIRTFTVGGSQPAPSPSPTPSPTPTPTPSPSPTPSPAPAPGPGSVSVSLSGVTSGEVVSGSRTVSATVAGNPVNARVEFFLNNKLYSTDTSAPFCMVNGSGNDSCGAWDSSSVGNGSYSISVVAAASGLQNATQSVGFTVTNKAIAPTITTKKNDVVVGVPNQQATGVTRTTVPAASAQNARSITYRVNDNPVATTTGTSPATTIDTKTLSNGKSKVSATIEKNNGEKEVLQSEITVKNDALTSSSNWLRDNIVITLFIGVIASFVMFFGIRFGIGKYREYQLNRYHIASENYTFVQPQEQAFFQQQAVNGLAAVFIVSVGFLSVTRFGSSAFATGLGFIEEIETSSPRPTEYTLGTDAESGEVYVRLNYTAPTTNPNPTPTLPPSSDANILQETFEGRGQSISGNTLIDGNNTFAKLNYGGIPVAGFCIYDQSPSCYSDADSRLLPAFDSAVKFSGQYSARFSVASVGRDTQGGSFYHQSFTRSTTAYATFWWRMDGVMANAGGNPSLLHWRGDYGEGPQYADIRLNANRNLTLSNHNGSGGVAGNYQYSPDTWYEVSLQLDGPSGMSRIIVRNQQGEQLQDTTHYYQAGGDIGFIEFGVLGGYLPSYSSIASMWFDDVRISTSPISGSPVNPAPAPNPPPPTPPAPTPPPPAPAPNPTPTPPPAGSAFSENFDSGSPNFIAPTGAGPHGGLSNAFYSNGRAYPDPGFRDTSARANMSVGANQFAEATLTIEGSLSSYMGITVRTDIESPAYQWYKLEKIDGGGLRIASLFHNPATGGHGFAECSSGFRFQTFTSYKLRLEIRGQNLIGYVNDNPVIQCADNTEFQITSGGTPGIIMYGQDAYLDNFSAGSLDGVPAPGGLPGLQQMTITLRSNI